MSLLSRIIHAIFDAKPMTEEEVAQKLDAAEKQGSERLAWRTSIIDLLKLLNLPSDQIYRDELAHDLGFSGRYAASEGDNEKLRKLVMEDVAKHYTKIPTA